MLRENEDHESNKAQTIAKNKTLISEVKNRLLDLNKHT